MCGLIGILLANRKDSVKQEIYTGLTMLQHRGQDSAGIVTSNGERVNLRKETGLVNQVFDVERLMKLTGSMGIGHVRYPSEGSTNLAEAQPFYTNTPFGIALAANGNLTSSEVEENSIQFNFRHTNTDSKFELMLNLLANEVLKGVASEGSATPDVIFQATEQIFQLCKGAYACVVMIHNVGLVAFRDVNGIRPVCYGSRKSQSCSGNDFCIASESVALDVLGYDLIDDVLPGQTVFIDLEGNMHMKTCSLPCKLAPCIFEYVYIARADSTIDHVSVHQARCQMGVELAKAIREKHPDEEIDIVSSVPETSRTTALQTAISLGVSYEEALIKNRYIARTFIMPGQTHRLNAVRQKLNPVKAVVNGKTILLVDDSIVRGTTSSQILEMLKSAGAKKVFFASASPPVRFPNFYGIDMPTYGELIAHNHTEEQVAAEIGTDWVIYQTEEGLKRSVTSLEDENHKFDDFESSCFDGHYLTGDITPRTIEEIITGEKDIGYMADSLDIHNNK